MSRVLITGVSGFIGRALAQRLLAEGAMVFGLASPRGHSPVGLSGCAFIRLPHPDLHNCLAEWRPNSVFHCAGSSRPARSLEDPAGDFVSTVPAMLCVLEAVRSASPQSRVIYVSSAAVYGQPERLPILESDPVNPISPYGYHKWMAELLCREYSEIFGLQTVCARVFSAYGGGLRKQIVWDAITKLGGSGEAVFHGTGKETRDFIHIDDLVEALVRLEAEPTDETHEVCNVASGVETRIDTVVATVARILGRPEGTWRFLGDALLGTPVRWCADTAKLASTGFIPRVAFEAGVLRTVTDHGEPS